jgi:uncharacterized protein YoxC
MRDVILGVGVGAFIIYSVCIVYAMRSVIRMSSTINDFIRRTEGKMESGISELRETLGNMRKITGDISAVTEEVKRLYHTVAAMEENLENIYGSIKDGLGTAETNIAGLKAGIKTGVVTLVKNIKKGRSDDHERGT